MSGFHGLIINGQMDIKYLEQQKYGMDFLNESAGRVFPESMEST
jgi:hypothetical protein